MTEVSPRNTYRIRVLERWTARRAGMTDTERIPFVHFSLIISGTAFGGFVLPGPQFEGLIADLRLRPEPGAGERYCSETGFGPEPGEKR